MSCLIEIDASQGEGGGQVLRTALALSVVTARPLRIANIRAGREKPGLMRQHLVCVNAAAAICGGSVEGAHVGSTQVALRPGPAVVGDYHFVVGTAGSTMLVLQSVLPALMLLDAPSTVTIDGGTHAIKAPTAEFITRAFLPLLERMGPRVSLEVVRRGFYPAGGGRVVARIEPQRSLRAISLHERGTPGRTSGVAVVSRIGIAIARRELSVLSERLSIADEHAFAVEDRNSPGPGNALVVSVESEHVTEVFSAIGERGRSAEAVASDVADQVREYLRVGAPVGPHLADQLLLPMALAGAGEFTTGPLTLHSRTNIGVIEAVLGRRFSLSETPEGRTRVVVAS